MNLKLLKKIDEAYTGCTNKVLLLSFKIVDSDVVKNLTLSFIFITPNTF